MVRGVHKKIIEVADTQNEFFERAILIVKEGFRDEDPERLRQKGIPLPASIITEKELGDALCQLS